MIDHLTMFPADVVALAFHGQVTKADYQAVFLPAIVEELKKYDKMRLYYEIAPDFIGFDAGAMWDDFAVGMEHYTRWDKVAVVTDLEWIERASQLFGMILPSRVRVFPTLEKAAARTWVSAASTQIQE